MALMRWKAWVGIAKPNGGMIRAGETFVADEADPRCRNGRAKLLGPAEPERGPSKAVAKALTEAAKAATAKGPEPVAVEDPEPEAEPETAEPEPKPEAAPVQKRRKAGGAVTEFG